MSDPGTHELAMEALSSQQNLIGRMDDIIEGQAQLLEGQTQLIAALLSGGGTAGPSPVAVPVSGRPVPVEEEQVMTWFRELTEGLAHARPPEVSVRVEGKGGSRVVRLDGQSLAYATSVWFGDEDFPFGVDESTTLRVTVADLAARGVTFPTAVTVRRKERSVGRGILRV